MKLKGTILAAHLGFEPASSANTKPTLSNSHCTTQLHSTLTALHYPTPPNSYCTTQYSSSQLSLHNTIKLHPALTAQHYPSLPNFDCTALHSSMQLSLYYTTHLHPALTVLHYWQTQLHTQPSCTTPQPPHRMLVMQKWGSLTSSLKQIFLFLDRHTRNCLDAATQGNIQLVGIAAT